MIPALVLAAAAAPMGCGVNYLDPCQRLAYRICGCELTQSQQRACETDRIQQQQDSVTPTAEEAEVCSQALTTCTCEALDQNRTDLCGFSRDETEVPIVEPDTSAEGEPA
jgi:hypothetical protein